MSTLLPVVSECAPDAERQSCDFSEALADHGLGSLIRTETTWLQINVGKLCNQACNHCHVEAGPKRTEIMSAEVAERLIALMRVTPSLTRVDFTGGAPELNPSFRKLVLSARSLGLEVIDRCNLTVLFEPGMQNMAKFLADNQVQISASLPCYSQGNVDAQRGKGVFDKSIRGLQLLNELGYGGSDSHSDKGLGLDLVYNPGGAFLPPPQEALEASYRKRLHDDFGIVFDNLLTITNMPIRRFAHYLEREGTYDEYMGLLRANFNPGTVPGLMCRSLISVGWDGTLHDCDFNQMLELELGASVDSDQSTKTATPTVWNVSELSSLAGRNIAIDSHCFGCTAGAGSSCGGALT